MPMHERMLLRKRKRRLKGRRKKWDRLWFWWAFLCPSQGWVPVYSEFQLPHTVWQFKKILDSLSIPFLYIEIIHHKITIHYLCCKSYEWINPDPDIYKNRQSLLNWGHNAVITTESFQVFSKVWRLKTAPWKHELTLENSCISILIPTALRMHLKLIWNKSKESSW